MDVFISYGMTGEPTEFNNDLEFKKQNYLKISSSTFPTMTRFIAAVRVNGFEHNGNVFH